MVYNGSFYAAKIACLAFLKSFRLNNLFFVATIPCLCDILPEFIYGIRMAISDENVVINA